MPIDPRTGQPLPYPGDPGAPPGFAGAPGGGAGAMGPADPASMGALDPMGQLAAGGTASPRPGMVLAALLQHIEQREAMAQQILQENQDVGLVAEQIMAALAGPPPETLTGPAGTESQALTPGVM